ncbi:MAG: hypothetical protein JW869_03690 [Candidatus Omnitrophica bacterium]|nr:hypothetical protein [Candidatus Omnitrophota bacterium]
MPDSDVLVSDLLILKQRLKAISAYQWLGVFSFLSGLAALIYEVIWTRVFANILGSTAFAMSCVFSVFLLSLAIGAHLFGRLIKKARPDSLFLYAIVELILGCLNLSMTYLLIQHKVKIALALPASDSIIATLFIQLACVFLFIGLPTMLMGGTFPLIVTASKKWVSAEKTVAPLYGWNTLGGALGSFLCGFVLILHLGLYGTILLASFLNLMIGLGAIFLIFKNKAYIATEQIAAQDEPQKEILNKKQLLIALAFLSGLIGLSFEILWGRLAKFFLGDRTLATSALLTIYLLCLGAGSFLASYLHSLRGKIRFFNTLQILALVLGLSGLTHIVFIRYAYWIINAGAFQSAIPLQLISVVRFAISFAIMAVPVTITGIIFPFIMSNVKGIASETGSTVGYIYFVNTIGSALGGICAGYFISRTLGTLSGFYLLISIVVFISMCLFMYATANIKAKTIFAVLLIGVFIYQSFQFPDSLVMLSADEEVVAENEDEYGVQVISINPQGLVNVKNNRLQLIYYLGLGTTSFVQQMQAHLPMLYVGDCKNVLNIGTGYGITAGTFSLYPQLESIETVEILPFLAQRQDVFGPYNFEYFKDPRVRIIVDDGRHYLNSTNTKYDVISVNVLDPYLPGSADLFTADFWQEVKQHLKPGGVMLQLIWGGDIPLLIRGLKETFPKLLLVPAYNNSFNVLAFNVEDGQDIAYDESALSERAKRALAQLGITDTEEFLEHALKVSSLISERYMRALAERPYKGRLHTDSTPILEYKWAAGTSSVFDSPSDIK